MTERIRLLFLCTGNSCRSQMAEGCTRHLKGFMIEPYSAGVEVAEVDPLAVRVMAEAGVDISAQRSKHVSEVSQIPFDVVVTLCSHARETCPFFPGAVKKMHVEFDDPPFLTQGMADDEQRLTVYRRVRDEICRFVDTLPDAFNFIEDGHKLTGTGM